MHKSRIHNWKIELFRGTGMVAAVFASVLLFSPGFSFVPSMRAQGMPEEARENIHTLFSQHTNVVRAVTLTEDGYVAVTQSDDTEVAKALQAHVSQMRERLQGGRTVRGWDPAFRELVEHYDDITHRVEKTEKGLKIIIRGKTPEAVAVVKNHAAIISAFVDKGWAEHDVRHPRASIPAAAPVDAMSCCDGTSGGFGGEDEAELLEVDGHGCARCRSN